MPTTPQAWVLIAAFVIHVGLFWDGPRQWVRAHRQGRVTPSAAYRWANAASVAILLAAAVVEILWPARPAIRPWGPGWDVAAWVAAGTGILALGSAAWAKVSLGRWFAPTAAVFPGHRMVTRGPYRWLRHPMYAGWLAYLVSLAFAANSSVVAAAAVFVGPLIIFLGRHETRLLADAGTPLERSNAN